MALRCILSDDVLVEVGGYLAGLGHIVQLRRLAEVFLLVIGMCAHGLVGILSQSLLDKAVGL